MKPYRFFSITLLMTLFLLAIPASLVWVFDPFFIYHKSFFIEDAGFDNMDRLQNAGLINSWLNDSLNTYDTVIIGTSMSQNFPLQAHTLKLTLTGGVAKEHRLVAEKAISTGKVKTIIWEVYNSYCDPDPNARHPESPLPEYLYNKNPFDDWRYFFNNDAVKKSIKFAMRIKNRVSMDKLYAWGLDPQYKGDFAKFSSPENIKTLKGGLKGIKDLPLTAKMPAQGIPEHFPNLDENLLPILKTYSDIQFKLYFPPVSYYAYVENGNVDFWTRMQLRRILLDAVEELPNVEVYGFDLEYGIGDTLSVYKDKSHYAPWVNEMMLESIKAKKNKLSAESYLAYEHELTRRVMTFYSRFMKD